MPIVPIAENKTPVWGGFESDCGEVEIVGFEKIREVSRPVSRALRQEIFLIDSFSVNVPKEGTPPVFRGEVFAFVDAETTVGVAAASFVGGVFNRLFSNEVCMVCDGLYVFVNVGIKMPHGVGLTQVIGSLDDVPEVGDDAGFRKKLALRVEVEAPWV